jgi:hypothetical protein
MIEKTEQQEFDFESAAHNILPGVTNYYCEKHDVNLKDNFPFYTDVGTINNKVFINDIDVDKNRFFKYQIIKPAGVTKTKRVVFLFHGFNEKSWEKYWSWANFICKNTGSSVVLFPIAFHMQRAPESWSNIREMYILSEQRKKRYPNIVHSSLSNVAISMRLHSMPQRFIWSGMQTYYDIIQFIEECKDGKHPLIHKDFNFNIFAYSIGGFLAKILKLTNYKNYFDQTKVCLFCSGATFNRLSPVSKFILDSEANVALYSFMIEHFDKIVENDALLSHYINEDHMEGMVFYSMLDYHKMRAFREKLLKKYENQIYAITLKKDEVIPSYEVKNTLKGAYNNINILVDELDFNRNYIHENPFAGIKPESNEARNDFNTVFRKVCQFFN